jgi:hypothetical protein
VAYMWRGEVHIGFWFGKREGKGVLDRPRDR